MTSQSNLPDLDDLMQEASDSIPDLDDLLGTAKAEAKDKAEVKATRNRLAKGGLSDRERGEDLARLREWESRNLYKPVANVACFTESCCAKCGDYTYLFTGLMERQAHRHIDTTQRWLKTDTAKTDLDNEVMVKRTTTPFCVQCMTEVGFTFNNAYTEDGEELAAADAPDLPVEVIESTDDLQAMLDKELGNA